MTADGVDRAWWKEAVVYQIYPRSFNDTDGDGVGDLPGVLEKVDYLDELGVDVVWLNPVYESPNADNGYDIADYRAIMDEFGTMADWEALLEALHERDMRLIMDLVVNHTSDEHEWFVRSRTGEEPYDDDYYWRGGEMEDAAATGGEGKRPNNWESFFGGPAWSYDEGRGAWYLHLFDRKQPDLNWRNKRVRDDVFGMMRWWFEKGIDGFRMDVINLISKADGLPDGDPGGDPVGTEHFINGPRIHEHLGEMNERVLSEYDAMTVGETVGMSAEEAAAFVGDGPLDMLIHFEHMNVDTGEDGVWDRIDLDLPAFKAVFDRWQTALHGEGWNCLYLENHDQPRSISRFGDDGEHRVESAKLLATLLCTLRGTPFVYQGQEIGMTNTSFEDRSELRDVWAHNFVDEALDSDEYASFDEIRDVLETCSRDNARTPVQWSDEENAGFTDGEPWIALNENYPAINVERAREDETSIWYHYRDLIDVRSEHDVLIYGDYEDLLPDHERLWAYVRTLGDERALVILNVSKKRERFEADLEYGTGELLIANYPDPDDIEGELRPYEARAYRLD